MKFNMENATALITVRKRDSRETGGFPDYVVRCNLVDGLLVFRGDETQMNRLIESGILTNEIFGQEAFLEWMSDSKNPKELVIDSGNKKYYIVTNDIHEICIAKSEDELAEQILNVLKEKE